MRRYRCKACLTEFSLSDIRAARYCPICSVANPERTDIPIVEMDQTTIRDTFNVIHQNRRFLNERLDAIVRDMVAFKHAITARVVALEKAAQQKANDV